MISDSEINLIISSFLEEGEVLYKTYIDNNLLYVITVDKEFIGHDDDDRYSTVGGRGPLKIDLLTHKIERIHYLDFPSDLIEEEPTPNNEQIIFGINNRGYINEKDIYNFLLNEYGEGLTTDYNFFEFDEKVIGLNFKNNDIENRFRSFFKSINAKLIINENLKIMVERVTNA